MLKIILFFILLTIQLAHAMAEPLSKVSPTLWTSDSWATAVKTIPQGNVMRGKRLETKGFCTTCHGDKGIAPSRNTPSLAGQDPLYIYKALMDFKSGLWHIDNKSLGMQALTLPLSKQDMSDLAAFYSAQQRPKKTKSLESMPSSLAACTGCHSANGGVGLTHSGPALGGQSVYYLMRQITAFKNHKRKTDVNGIMASMVQMLSDKQQKIAAEFFSRQ